MGILQQLYDRLDTCPGPNIPLNKLAVIISETLTSTQEEYTELAPFESFSDETYKRNLLKRGSHYDVLLLCWEAGQYSPIHDHAGSNCAVKIVRGVGTEVRFGTYPEGLIKPLSVRLLMPSQCIINPESYVHQMANLQHDSKRLVTLHIYSPSLLTMGRYNELGHLVEKIAEGGLISGAGI